MTLNRPFLPRLRYTNAGLELLTTGQRPTGCQQKPKSVADNNKHYFILPEAQPAFSEETPYLFDKYPQKQELRHSLKRRKLYKNLCASPMMPRQTVGLSGC